MAPPAPSASEALDYAGCNDHNRRKCCGRIVHSKLEVMGAAILALIAFLAWVVLLLMFVATAVRWAIRFGRKADATKQN
jgi:hypothetical protein